MRESRLRLVSWNNKAARGSSRSCSRKQLPQFSKRIRKQILKRMEGARFYRSIKSKRCCDSDDSDSDSSSDFCYEKDNEGEYGFGCYTKDDKVDAHDEDDVEEIFRSELHGAIRPFYIGEWFMIETGAQCGDVSFKDPNHSCTQAFVLASR